MRPDAPELAQELDIVAAGGFFAGEDEVERAAFRLRECRPVVRSVLDDPLAGLERIEKERSLDDAERIAFAFRVCFARDPSTREVARIQTYLDAKKKADPNAAWNAVARVLMNLDEFITRE